MKIFLKIEPLRTQFDPQDPLSVLIIEHVDLHQLELINKIKESIDESISKVSRQLF